MSPQFSYELVVGVILLNWFGYHQKTMERLYFIRVGGTAMGGVAAACKALGDEVFGSEQELYEPMKGYLEAAEVEVYRTFDPAQVESIKPDRIVVGNAVSRGNPELELALNQKQTIVSLPQIVGEKLIGKNTSIVIAGTHGKTTTTAMTANLLESGGLEPGFLIGGVPGNFTVSCRPVPRFRHNTQGGFFVVEGDEYDTAYFDKRSKFLLYRPYIAVVNNIEFDHADIFTNLEEILKSFRLFIRLVPQNGLILANGDDPNVASILGQAVSPVETFGLGDQCDWRADSISEGESGAKFDVRYRGELMGSVEMGMTGEHNVRNMLAGIAVARRAGMDFESIARGASSFVPPRRRMEVKGTWRGALVIDDFGHHPTAIKETLKALRAKYPDRRLIVAFEPRSNSTTRNLFQNELAHCFAGATAVALGALDRPERYSDEQRLDTSRLVDELCAQGIEAWSLTLEEGREKDWGSHIREKFSEWVRADDVIVLFSNGDFGGLRAMLKE